MRRGLAWMIAAGLALCCCKAAPAAFDAFLHIEGIPGEILDEKHLDWIGVVSYGHDVVQHVYDSETPLAVSGLEPVRHRSFRVVKHLDRATPKLALACCSGQHIPSAMLELWTQDIPNRFYEVVFENLRVVSAAPTAQEGDPMPTEEVTFNYERIRWTYTQIANGEPVGSVETTWDITADTDGDGIPDSYEEAFGLDMNDPDDRDSDHDGDGLTAYQEFVAGTAANRADSVFKVSFLRDLAGSSAEITWTSTPGRRYDILVAADMRGPWRHLATAPAAEAGNSTTATFSVPDDAVFALVRVDG